MPVIGTTDSTRTQFTPEAWAYSHDMGEGLKLMEHSWLDARLPRTIMVALKNNPQRLVWAGDYADPEDGGNNLYVMASNQDDGFPEVISLPGATEAAPRYILNHDKMTFVDLTHCPSKVYSWTDGKPYTVHPLPLLTCEGNGRGGGDWRGGQGDKHVGTWARDLLETSDTRPHGFIEFRPDFIEGE